MLVKNHNKDRKTILIVDDNQEIVQFITEFISDRFNCVIKSSGEDAVKYAAECNEHDLDIVITDYKLPDISGLEVLIKVKEIRSTLPVIIMTGYGDEDVAVKVFKHGARDYLKKPFESIQLIKAIDFCLSLKSIDKDRPRRVMTHETDSVATKLISSVKSHDHTYKMERALKYIEDNCSFKLNIEKVAKQACISKSHFSKIFKKMVGCTYQSYLNKIRIDKARTMLLNPNNTITYVAYSVGYYDLTHFERIFKKIVGQTPTQYRKRP